MNPVKYYQLTYDNKNGSAVPQNTAADFYSACLSGDMDCVLPLAGVAESEEEGAGTDAGTDESQGEEKSQPNKRQKEAEINEEGFENRTRNYYAGQMGEKIKNKSEALGGAVFKKDKYIDKIGSIETELYNILMCKFKENNITFRSTEKPEKPITVQLEEKRCPSYTVDIENKKVSINIILECELLSASHEYKNNNSIEEMSKSASEMVTSAAEKLIDKLYKEYNTDTLGICGRAKNKFITIQEYDKFKESFNPQEWSFDVNTDLTMELTGMTYYY